MKVSIIVPSYNQEPYLRDAINSALSQTHPDIEIVVVDDGSTDNSLKIAKEYPIKVVSQTNRGLSSARNTGVMNSTGEYILPLDADDILEMHCVGKLLSVARETSADVVAPSIKTFGIAEEVTHLMPSPNLNDFRYGNRIAYCALIRREALLEVGGYSSKMVEGYEDLHLWVNLLSRGKKILTVPDVLFNYRVKEQSMWRDALKNHKKLIGQINKDFPEACLAF